MRAHFRAFDDFKLLFPSKREKVLKMRNYDIRHCATKVRMFIYHNMVGLLCIIPFPRRRMYSKMLVDISIFLHLTAE